MKRSLHVFVAAGVLVAAGAWAAPSRIPTVVVRGPRVHLGDLVEGLPDAARVTDLGPTPAFDGMRFVAREEVAAAMKEAGVGGDRGLPSGYQIKRQLRSLPAVEVASLVSEALTDRLPRGATLSRVIVARAVTVPEGWTEIRCELPHPPHRAGAVSSTVAVAFLAGEEPVWTMTVPVELLLSEAAVAYDVRRGSRVTLVVRRGLVEVRGDATVTVDADVGDVAPVSVGASGRMLQARLEDARTAVMVERP